jgi:serine/threonine protein kinase
MREFCRPAQRLAAAYIIRPRSADILDKGMAMMFQTGEVVGDYEILGILGTGGMGRVFRVRNLISDRIEAMKIVLPDATTESDLAERFLREIKVHASLEHPHIAVMRTAFRVQERVVMIMELVEGGSLAEVLRRGPLEVPAALSYAAQTLSALAYAHARGVVHRDVKPANIIVTPGGTVKVTDFGIARAGGTERLTSTGMALGSLYYMSPEQIRGSVPDGRADIYSLGVTLYEMVTGVQPVRGENEYAIMHAHLTEEPVSPSQLVFGLPGYIPAVILKAMAKVPENRFQSAEEFRAALGVTGEVAQIPPPAPLPAAVKTEGTLDPDQVMRIESHMMRAVGPIARHLVSKAARRAASIDELCKALAEEVSGVKEREEFLRSCAKIAAAAPASTRSQTANSPGTKSQTALNRNVIEQNVIEEAQRKLAKFMGPIAKILVDRTARKAHSAQEFYAMLAAEIPSERDRALFVSSLAV